MVSWMQTKGKNFGWKKGALSSSMSNAVTGGPTE